MRKISVHITYQREFFRLRHLYRGRSPHKELASSYLEYSSRHSRRSMASSYHPPPPPSAGEQKRGTNVYDDPTKSFVYRLSTAAADSLSWFCTTYKSIGSTDKHPNAVHSALGTALVFTAGFAALAMVPPKARLWS